MTNLILVKQRKKISTTKEAHQCGFELVSMDFDYRVLLERRMNISGIWVQEIS